MRFRPSHRATLRTNAAYIASLEHRLTAPELSEHTRSALARQIAEAKAILAKPVLTRAKAGSSGKPLEHDVQTAVMALLHSHPRITKAIRFNSGAAYGEHNGKKYYVKFASELVVDVYFFGPGLWGWFEIKRPGWTRPSDEREEKQSAFLAAVRASGGIGMFITDAAQVAEALR